MSAPKRKDGGFSLVKAKAEARGEPFPLDLDADTTVLIPRPTGGTLFDIEEATTSREVLALLVGDGDHADAVFAALDDADFEVIGELADAMKKHFGLGEARASRG